VALARRRLSRLEPAPLQPHERALERRPGAREGALRGDPGHARGDLLHDSTDDLAKYLDRQNRYTTLAARQAFERGRSANIAHLLLSPVVRFLKFYVFRLGFLDGMPGLLHISIGCMNSYLKYAKLIELRRAEKDK